MNDKFKNIPMDDDTKILLTSNLKFGELDCVFQAWVYDHIQGNSLIFLSDDLKLGTDEELKRWILATSEIVQDKSIRKMTISRNPEEHPYVFVNFNFQNVA